MLFLPFIIKEDRNKEKSAGILRRDPAMQAEIKKGKTSYVAECVWQNELSHFQSRLSMNR